MPAVARYDLILDRVNEPRKGGSLIKEFAGVFAELCDNLSYIAKWNVIVYTRSVCPG